MQIKIHYYLIISIIYSYYLDKIEYFVLFYIFAIVHEIFHIVAAMFLKVKVCEIAFLPIGVNATFSENINYKEEFIIAISGPIASLVLAIFFFGKIYGIINFIIFITNIIPIYPLDGGRIFRIIFVKLFKYKNGIKLYEMLSKSLITILIIFSVILAVYFKNYNLIIFSIYIYMLMNKALRKEYLKSIINEISGIEI